MQEVLGTFGLWYPSQFPADTKGQPDSKELEKEEDSGAIGICREDLTEEEGGGEDSRLFHKANITGTNGLRHRAEHRGNRDQNVASSWVGYEVTTEQEEMTRGEPTTLTR